MTHVVAHGALALPLLLPLLLPQRAHKGAQAGRAEQTSKIEAWRRRRLHPAADDVWEGEEIGASWYATMADVSDLLVKAVVSLEETGEEGRGGGGGEGGGGLSRRCRHSSTLRVPSQGYATRSSREFAAAAASLG